MRYAKRVVAGFACAALAAIAACTGGAPGMHDTKTQTLPAPHPSIAPRVPFATCANTGVSALGTGSDGAFVAPSGTSTFPTIATSVVATSETTVTVQSSTGFSPNDLVLLHQTQNAGNDIYATGGIWEIDRVLSTTSTTLTLEEAVQANYGTTLDPPTVAQAVRVPQFTDVTIATGNTVTAVPWNGTTGGIVAFVATGTVSIVGALDVSGTGFRGGAQSADDGGHTGETQGESTAGLGTGSTSANAGGGGAGMSGSSAGGGGYGTAGGQGAVSSGHDAAAGSAGGSAFGDNELLILSLGPGGGGSYENAGGNGGGAVVLAAAAVSIPGSLLANGSAGAGSGAGGGAGGALLVQAQTASITGTPLSASGGAGVGSGGQGTTDPGGTGGVGRVRVACGTLGGATCVGASGSFSSPTATMGAFCSVAPPNGPGGACSVASDCISGACAGGGCCATGGGTCTTSTSSCSNPTGACLLNTGQPVSGNDSATCESGFASDGFCCNTACASPCDACATSLGATANGTCSPASAGYVGSPACATGYVCDGTNTTCATSCTTDTDCAATDYCTPAGACAAQKAQGAACDLATDCMTSGTCRECATGNCVDGFCCSSACDATCETCAASLQQTGGGGNGTCSPSSYEKPPPRGSCSVSEAGACGPDGTCDGKGSCNIFAPSGTSCGASSCNGSIVSGAVCNGSGTCATNSGVDCAPFACANGTCETSCATDTDCATGAYCKGSTCVKQESGAAQPCTSADQCTSGFCFDGYCCNEACNGQCETCDVPGAQGTCTNITGAPQGGRAPCAGTGTCAGTCDGTNGATCSFANSGQPCGSTCASGQETDSTCTSAGTCVAGAPIACKNNIVTCDGNSCAATCATDTDCATGFQCVSGACTPKAGATCIDQTHSQPADPSQAAVSCAPYICGTSGSCLQSCASVGDCATPAACNPGGQCVEPASAPTSSSGGCAVGRVGATDARGAGSEGLAFIALFAAAGAVRRSRRNRRAPPPAVPPLMPAGPPPRP